MDNTTATLSIEFDLAEVLQDSYINEIRPFPDTWQQRPYPVQEQV